MLCLGLAENRNNLFPTRKTNLSYSPNISSPKTQNITNPQNKLPQKFRATRYVCIMKANFVPVDSDLSSG